MIMMNDDNDDNHNKMDDVDEDDNSLNNYSTCNKRLCEEEPTNPKHTW